MIIEAVVVGGERIGSGESDILSVSDDFNGLTFVVEAYTKNKPTQTIIVEFSGTRGYRVLDEGDLMRYEECHELWKPYCVHEIISGGWLNGETLDDGVLTVSKAVGIREWFIATTNSCANVLSSSSPKITYA